MISVFGNKSTLDDIRGVELVRPDRAGRYWQGVSHGDLVDTIIDEVTTRGWKVKETQFNLSNDEQDLAAAFALKIPEVKSPEGQDYSLGLITSNAMRKSMKLVVGTNVRVCHNGMATGEIVLARKHTTGFDVFQEIEFAIDTYADRIKRIPQFVASLKNTELSPEQADKILMEAGRQGLMPWSRIGKVDDEYRHPTFAENAGENCWGLLNAFTLIVKENPPMAQMDQMNGFRSLLPIETSLATAV